MEHCQSPTRRYASLCAIRSIKPSSITTMTIYLVSMTRSVRAALPLRRFLGAALDVVVVEEVAVLIAAVTLADALSPSAFAALVTTLVPSAPSRLSVALSAPVTITCRCALRETTPMPGRAFRWPALRSSTQTLLLSVAAPAVATSPMSYANAVTTAASAATRAQTPEASFGSLADAHAAAAAVAANHGGDAQSAANAYAHTHLARLR